MIQDSDMEMLPQPPKLRKKKQSEPRWRLVYRVDENGKVRSYNHIEYIQSERILQIVKYVISKKDNVTVHELHKHLKIPKVSLQRLADKLCGVLWIDKMDENGEYQIITSRMIDVKRGQYNKRANLPKTPPYLDEKAPYIFSPATA